MSASPVLHSTNVTAAVADEDSIWERCDEVVTWSIVAPNTLRATLVTALASAHYSYALAVVPQVSGKRDPRDAVFTGNLGRVSPLNYAERADFAHVRPLAAYHVGYQEDGLWHWTSIAVPMQIVPYTTSPTELAVQFRFDDDPRVAGIRTVVTAPTGYRSERESTLDTMPLSPETGWPYLQLRNLTTGTGFTFRAWPMYEGGEAGLETLPVLSCTRPALEVSFEAVSDTSVLLRVGRPVRQTPLGRDVEPWNCRVEDAVIRLWEDPVPSLMRNARRVSAGRELVHVPLQRREVKLPPLAEGEFAVRCIEGLAPATTHFLTATSRTDTFAFDEPVRVRFTTCHELRLSSPVSMEPRALALSWEVPETPPPPHYTADVRYPSSSNLFNDREELNPYLSGGPQLPDSAAWGRPVRETSYASQRMAFEVCLRAATSGACTVTSVPQAAAVVTGLEPATAYELRIRGVKKQAEGVFALPWSRPLFLMTPSDLLARIVRRDTDRISVAWGQFLPPPIVPGHFGGVRNEFLPEVDASTPPDAAQGAYYYLEPLPFLPGSAVGPNDDASSSGAEESEDDEEGASPNGDGTSTVRLLNHAPRPTPLFHVAIRVPWVAPEGVTVAVYAAAEGEEPLSTVRCMEDTDRQQQLRRDQWLRWANDLDEDAAGVPGAPVDSMSVAASDGVAEFTGLRPGGDFTVRVLRGRVPQPEVHPQVTLRVRTLDAKTNVGRCMIADIGPHDVAEQHAAQSAPSRVKSTIDASGVRANRLSNVRNPVRLLRPAEPSVWTALLLDAMHPPTSLHHQLRTAELSEVFASVTIQRSRNVPAGATFAVDAMLLELGLDAAAELGWCVARDPLPARGVVRIQSDEALISEDDTEDGSASMGSSLLRPHDDAPAAADVSEYLAYVQRLDMVGDAIVPAGAPEHHYFCTAGDTVQVVNLSAAARYDITLSRWDNARCAWSQRSKALSVTTVQRVLIEAEELAPEYVKLRWGRRRKDDSIVEYMLRLAEAEPTGRSDPPVAFEIPVRHTSYSVSIARELRHNAVVDASVVPKYANGHSGVASNPVRFLHLNLRFSIVERGAEHLQVVWGRVDTSRLPIIGKALLLVRVRRGSEWERTTDAGVDAKSCVVPDLRTGTQYHVCVSLLCLLARSAQQLQSDDAMAMSVASTLPPPTVTMPELFDKAPAPFTSCARTLTAPTARVARVGETFMDVVWNFVAEIPEDAAASVAIAAEIKVVDERDERHFVVAKSTGKGTTNRSGEYATGTGSVTIAGLLPDRRYKIFVRQKYGCGSWGPWTPTNANVPTLSRLALDIVSVGDSFVHARARRPALDTADFTEGAPLEGAVATTGHRFRFTVDHIGLDFTDHTEVTEGEFVFPGLDPNAPYTVSVEEWALDGWGVASEALSTYTLPLLVPVVTRRSINRVEISCSRDARMPSIRTDLCEPHDNAQAAAVSSLSAVRVSAVAITASGATGAPITVELSTVEGNLSAAWMLVDNLIAARPYRVDLVALYSNGCTTPKPTMLATMTLAMPQLWVSHLGEDTVTVGWSPAAPNPGHAAVFSALSGDIRDASSEGLEVETVQWDVRAVAAGTGTQAFQDVNATQSCASTPATRPHCTLHGLMPNTAYLMHMRSVDSGREAESGSGAFLEVGNFTTARFPSLRIEKLAENFVEVAWLDGAARDTAILAGSSSFFARRRNTSTEDSLRAENLLQGGDPDLDEAADEPEFEVVVFSESDIETGRYMTDPDCGTCRTTKFSERRVLVEGLDPKTRYVALGRGVHTIDGDVVRGAWAEKRPFATLALLVMRVVAVGLNFVDVTWLADEADAKANKVLPPLDPDLPADFRGTSTYFCALADTATAASAAAVQFQLRVMGCDADGSVKGLHSDRFVTNNATGVHSIVDLEPATSYAVSMRVCYEGLSGSWVQPCPLTTDTVPLAKVRATSQNGASFACLVKTSKPPETALAPPTRRHRVYEVTVDDPNAPDGKLVVLSVDEWCDFFISHLRRDQYYNVGIREVLHGTAYGKPVPLCGFWTQPYPPVITELQECRDGYASIVWGVMDSVRIGTLLTGRDVPDAFVYSVERGYRHGNTAVGWKEVAVTDIPSVRFKWQEGPSDRLERHCFRVRLSKLFVQEPGSDHKTPVWGDYSSVVYWRTPPPPGPPQKLALALLSDTRAVVRWAYPEGSKLQPQLSFTVLIDATRQVEGGDQLADGGVPGTAAASRWFLVGKTRNLHSVVDHLIPNTSYRIAIQAEGAFGLSPKASTITFTTRPVPNPEAATFDANRALPRAHPPVTGVPPHERDKDAATNMYDKYDIPRQRRLKALAALAGIKDKGPAKGVLKDRFRRGVRRIVAIIRRINLVALEVAAADGFDRNGSSPVTIAREVLQQPADRNAVIWRPGLFTVQERAAGSADMTLTVALGSSAVETTTPKARAGPRRRASLLSVVSGDESTSPRGDPAASAAPRSGGAGDPSGYWRPDEEKLRNPSSAGSFVSSTSRSRMRFDEVVAEAAAQSGLSAKSRTLGRITQQRSSATPGPSPSFRLHDDDVLSMGESSEGGRTGSVRRGSTSSMHAKTPQPQMESAAMAGAVSRAVRKTRTQRAAEAKTAESSSRRQSGTPEPTRVSRPTPKKTVSSTSLGAKKASVIASVDTDGSGNGGHARVVPRAAVDVAPRLPPIA